MNNSDVKRIVGNTPHMTFSQANRITTFINEHNIRNILELGFAHGVATSYMAAALSRFKGGSIVAIDRENARRHKPDIETLLARIGETDLVDIYYEPTSYGENFESPARIRLR